MAELLILGSSAGVPTGNRHNTGMAVKTDGKLYIIDCGCPVSTLLKQMGEDPRTVEAVFITHWHPDHASGLPMLIQDLQLTRRTLDLKLYGPVGTEHKIKHLQRIFFLPPEIYPFHLHVTEYDERTVYQDRYITVSFFKTRHLSADSWRKLDEVHDFEMKPIAYGIVMEVEGKKIVFSGDLLTSDDLLPALPGADLVVHEFGHIKPEGLRDFVVQHQIPHLLINHIHHDWDQRVEELQRLVADGHSGTVQVANDLMRLIV